MHIFGMFHGGGRSEAAVRQPRDELGRFADKDGQTFFKKRPMRSHTSDDAAYQRKPRSPVTVLVDESGNLGRGPASGKAFTMTATVTKDPDTWARIADRYPRNTRYRQGGPNELKYNTSSDFVRRSVLEDVMATGPSIHAVVISKADMSRANDEKVYIATTSSLMENVMKDPVVRNEKRGVRVVYDNHKYLQDGRAERITREIAKKNGAKLASEPEVRDSARCRGLQVHDFVAGAVGSKYNRDDSRDLEIIEPKTEIVRMRMK